MEKNAKTGFWIKIKKKLPNNPIIVEKNRIFLRLTFLTKRVTSKDEKIIEKRNSNVPTLSQNSLIIKSVKTLLKLEKNKKNQAKLPENKNSNDRNFFIEIFKSEVRKSNIKSPW